MNNSNPGRGHHSVGQSNGLGPSASQRPTSGIPSMPWNIVNFYNTADQPWNALSIAPSMPHDDRNDRKPPHNVGLQANFSSFHAYRNHPVPSESDLQPDDSGYCGTATAFSTENASVHGYEDEHFQAPRIDTLHLHPGETQLPAWQQSRRPASVSTAPEQFYQCQECGSGSRTKSELKKHILRHSKPFTCDIPGCIRDRGFSTKNDLFRHKKTVHADNSIPGHWYVCHHGGCGTKDKPKRWPRADNFRSHLGRVHSVTLKSDEDLDRYVHRQPNQGHALQGVGTAVSCPTTEVHALEIPRSATDSLSQPFAERHSSNAVFRDMQENLDALLPGSETSTSDDHDSSILPLVQEDDEDFVQEDVLADVVQPSELVSRSSERPSLALPGTAFSHSNSTQTLPLGNTGSVVAEDDLDSARGSFQLDNGQNMGGGAGLDLMAQSNIRSSSPALVQDDVAQTSNGIDSSPIVSSKSSPDLLSDISLDDKDRTELLKRLRKVPKELLGIVYNEFGGEQDENSVQDSGSQKHSFPCSHCNKIFSRQCELRKHTKRHERPYGCTYRDCTKTFGSKNDWKRHESSQHSRLEIWQCDEEKQGQKDICRRVFQRRESFQAHLHSHCSTLDAKAVEEKLERCRLGRHCKQHFWCGFCEAAIEIDANDVKPNAWSARCNHIDNHFCGRGGMAKKNISEWKHPEEPDEGATASPSRKRKHSDDDEEGANKRKATALNYMWKCCRCNSLSSIRHGPSCIDCSHIRCDMYCDIEVNITL